MSTLASTRSKARPKATTRRATSTPTAKATDLRLAAIDVGSNSLHMIVAQVDADGGATTLWRLKEMVGLGRSSFPSHRLSPDAIERAMVALHRFANVAKRRGAQKIVAVATSAVREAENGGDFIELARAETGVNIRVVSPRDEARLIYLGVSHAMAFVDGPHLIVDIGGGSAEFIVAAGHKPLMLESRKLGAARLTAQFIHSDPPQPRDLQSLLDHYDEVLTPIFRQIRSHDPIRIIGTSGTLENLALMCRGGDPPSNGKPLELTREGINKLVDKLLKMTSAQRSKIKGLDEKRQDQIVAGALLAQQVLKRLGHKKLAICSSALREGILLDYAARHLPDLAIRRNVPDPRRRSVLDLARKCDWNELHSLHVVKLTLALFDDLAPLHKLGRPERQLLEYAAMLHDIGWHISDDSHHKHSMYLIQNGGLQGFTPREINIIANLARYHRRSLPKPAHAHYTALSRDDRRIVDVGASLLRIADGLDRSHARVVESVRCRTGKRPLEILLSGKGDMQLELWAARRKTDMFEKTFGRKVAFLTA